MIATPYPYKNFHFQVDATPAELRRRIEARLANGLQWDEGRESLVGEVDNSGFLLKSVPANPRAASFRVVRGAFEAYRDGTRVHVQVTSRLPATWLWAFPLMFGAFAWASLISQLIEGVNVLTAVTSLVGFLTPFPVLVVIGAIVWVSLGAALQSKEEGYRTALLDILRTPPANTMPPAMATASLPTPSRTRSEPSFRSAAVFFFSAMTALALTRKLADIAFVRLTFSAEEIAAKHLHIAWHGRHPVLSDGHHLGGGQEFFLFVLFIAIWIPLTLASLEILGRLFPHVREEFRWLKQTDEKP